MSYGSINRGGRAARGLTVWLVAGLLVSSCSRTGVRDHQRAAEPFLINEAAKNGVALFDATCDEPESTVQGTGFECRASDGDGIEFAFMLTIGPDFTYIIEPQI